MKRIFFSALVVSVAISYCTKGQTTPALPMQSTFTYIPDSVQTSVYWYWLSGNVSKEGVVKDLEAMKKVGINRAFIGNIGLDDVPEGKVKMFSADWWEVLHTALKTATRLNIEIGLFNGPGWSQSGGPWVKPSQSMRYITQSQTAVKGPANINLKLPAPTADFQDVKVLAYPVAKGFNDDISVAKPLVTADAGIDSVQNIMDGNPATALHLQANKPVTVNVSTLKNYTLRSVVVYTTQQAVRLEGDVLAAVNGGFKKVKHFVIDRTNPALNVGFIPFGPAAISVPGVSAAAFKIQFTGISANCGITELKLSSTPVVDSYIEKTLAKMWPTPHPMWDAYQWPVPPDEKSGLAIDPDRVIDVSRFMDAEGNLKWKAPAGSWIIERFGMTSTQVTNSPAPPEGRGLEVDKMSKKHVADHFNAFMGEILRRIPAEDRKTWRVVVEDSYETGSQNWTDNLFAEFKNKYGYDPTPYLPVLQGRVVGSEDASDRFLWDLRRLIADDVSFNYVGGLREVAHKHGLTTWLENYGHWGYPGEFLQYGGQSDEIGGEFWSEGDLGDIENRVASSSAHIYGKTKVSAESFTAAWAPFKRYPAMLKQRGDRFFTEGINNTLLHVYITQPNDNAPGINTWFGVEFNRLNTWFGDMDVWVQYLKRCNYMLQQGQYVADAAYFIGEDAPKMTGVTDPALPKGYSFDYINADVIKQRVTVKNGRLTLPNGISYGILVLPKLATMRPELLRKITDLVRRGAVVLGPKPTRSPSLQGYPNADAEVKKMAYELWGEADGVGSKVNHFGQGKVLNGMDMQQAFALIKQQPDVNIQNSDDVLFIHRQMAGADIYFLSNQKNETVNITGNFRVSGKAPQLWNPLDGRVRNLMAFTDNGTITTVPLKLDALGSVFIIFKPSNVKGDTAKNNFPAPVGTFDITNPWMVAFDAGMRGPAKPVKFDTLSSWTSSSNDSIKYYSGKAVYSNTFKVKKLNKGSRYIINLGAVSVIAKVKVNGKEMGGVWTAPYQLDITDALKKGSNTLEIKVVNTWVNRLVGDSKLPAAERKTSALIMPDAKTPLESSGLLGPVTISEFVY